MRVQDKKPYPTNVLHPALRVAGTTVRDLNLCADSYADFASIAVACHGRCSEEDQETQRSSVGRHAAPHRCRLATRERRLSEARRVVRWLAELRARVLAT